uniref:Uncharacterized protein n=1 Tax=Periophthalmus magnuspinnatus TaxID=409849 RepID=A0A3B4BCE4_9GOBI
MGSLNKIIVIIIIISILPTNPEIQWNPLSQEDMNFILKTVKDKLVSSGIQKKEDKVFRPWRKKKAAAPATPEETSQGDAETPTNGWTDVSARRQLAIGINEVTRALERNELQLVLVLFKIPLLQIESPPPLPSTEPTENALDTFVEAPSPDGCRASPSAVSPQS